jgi:hypothetical protein
VIEAIAQHGGFVRTTIKGRYLAPLLPDLFHENERTQV